MNKIIPIVIAILLAGGVGYYLYTKQAVSPAVNTAGTSGNIFSSIQDALSKSLSLQCMFTDEQGRKTTAYIKAGAIHADIMGNDPTQQYNNSSVIIKDKKMYVWDSTKKQGMTMQVPDTTITPPSGSTGSSNSQGESAGDVMATLNKYKQDCKPAVVSDSLFIPPTDVTFQDLSKMMQPTGTMMPTGQPDQQQIQKMMQQYQQAPTNSSGY